MGNKNLKEINKEDYEYYCKECNDYFIKAKNEFKLEKEKKEIEKKIEEKTKKIIVFSYIKILLVKEKKRKNIK